jgi:hypothetical protein
MRDKALQPAGGRHTETPQGGGHDVENGRALSGRMPEADGKSLPVRRLRSVEGTDFTRFAENIGQPLIRRQLIRDTMGFYLTINSTRSRC